jgi:hypothetical protein
MIIQKWREIAELVALTAVVGSLAAVVIELRQTQEAIRSQTYQERAFQGIAFNLEVAQSPLVESSHIFSVDLDPDTLSESDYYKTFHFYMAVRIDVDNEYYQYQKGFLDDGHYLGVTVPEIRRFAPTWRKFGIKELRSDFRAEVDRVLAEESIPDFWGSRDRTNPD